MWTNKNKLRRRQTMAEVILKSKLDEYEKVCEEDEIIENELKTNKENSTMII